MTTGDLAGVALPTTQHGWAGGAGGRILATTDGGQTWVQQSSGTNADLHDVDFVSAERGWAVGAGDEVLATTDGGATWQRSFSGAGGNALLRSVDFVDDTHGWVVGRHTFIVSVVRATTDGGETWSEQLAPVGIGLEDVSFADRQHGFATGVLGAAYRTDDGGATWIPMRISADENFTAAVRLSDADGVVAGSLGVQGGSRLFRTADGGLTWTAVADLAAPVRDLAAVGATVVAVGDGGLVARSVDSGHTWTLEASGTSQNLLGVATADAALAIAVGAQGWLSRFVGDDQPAQPLALGLNAEQCTGDLGIGWVHEQPGHVFDAAWADLTGDGNQELVLAGNEGIRALRPDAPEGEQLLWERSYQARTWRLAVADVDGNGDLEIAAVTTRTATARAGLVLLDGATGDERWSRRLPGGGLHVRAVDLDGDGSHALLVVGGEVALVGRGTSLHLLDGATGAPRLAPRSMLGEVTHVAIGDVSGDGVPDAVVTQHDGQAVAVDLRTGQDLWRHQIPGSSASLQAVALGDLTGDGNLEVVVVGRGRFASTTSASFDSTTTIGSSEGYMVAALDSDGGLLWDFGNAMSGTAMFGGVALGDLTGDGQLDVIAHANRIGAGYLVALAGRGQEVAGVPTGEPVALWRVITTRSSGTHGVQPDNLLVLDGNAYVASRDGGLIAVRGDAATPQPGVGAVLGVPGGEVLWESVRTGARNRILPGPDAAGPALTDLAGDGLVAVRDPLTGLPTWTFDTALSPSLVASPGDGSAVIGAATRGGTTSWLDADGRRTGAQALVPDGGSHAVSVTVESPGDLVAVSDRGRVHAVSADTGDVLWEAALGGRPTGIAAGAGVVAVSFADGRLVGLDAATGATGWTVTRSGSANGVVSEPVTARFAATYSSGRLLVVDRDGGVEVDVATAGSAGAIEVLRSPTHPPGFALAAGGVVQAFDDTGVELWRTGAGNAVIDVAAGDLTGDGFDDVVASALGGVVFAAGGVNGTVLWQRGDLAANAFSIRVATVDLDGDGRTAAAVIPVALGVHAPTTVTVLDTAGAVLGGCTLRKDVADGIPIDLDGDGSEALLVATRQGDVYALRRPPAGL